MTAGVIARAVQVMDALARGEKGLSIREIAEQSAVSKSAVQRLLADLVATDLATQDPRTRHYQLGPRALAFGSAYQRRVDVRRAALPHMAALRDRHGETVGISVGLADQLLHVDQVEATSQLRARLDIGRPLPLWSGAPARVMLAMRDNHDIYRIVHARSEQDFSPANPPSVEKLLQDVELVRQVGYAFAFEETLLGVHTMSGPIRNSHGELIAVVSLTAPSVRLPRERMEAIVPDLLEAAAAISADLGWFGPHDLPLRPSPKP